MEKEEVELLPSGLATCLLDGDKEVRILKISPQSLTVRIDEEIKNNIEVKLAFFIFDEYRYEEVVVKNHSITKIIKEEFYFTYLISIKDDTYSQNVRKITKNYWKYIMLKNFGAENEFSKEMVGYPAEKDYDFYSVYSDEKRDWMLDIDNNINCIELINSVELAILLDNDILYKKYMENNKKNFQHQYLKDNFIDNNDLFKKQISRIYVGNEFCHNLFPDIKLLLNAEGKHSLHMPFYQTNTSQYCILYAMCTSFDRGNQKLVKQCPKYCTDYVFSYPKHLKIIGRYNSLFAFDDVILKDYSRLEKYLNNGIDRIVLNFI